MKQDSWLYSDSFLKRAFAIWGYNAVAGLIISIPFVILWFIFALMFFVNFAGDLGKSTELQRMMQEQMNQQPGQQ